MSSTPTCCFWRQKYMLSFSTSSLPRPQQMQPPPCFPFIASKPGLSTSQMWDNQLICLVVSHWIVCNYLGCDWLVCSAARMLLPLWAPPFSWAAEFHPIQRSLSKGDKLDAGRAISSKMKVPALPLVKNGCLISDESVTPSVLQQHAKYHACLICEQFLVWNCPKTTY